MYGGFALLDHSLLTYHTLALQQHGGQIFDANIFFLRVGHVHLKLENNASE